MSGEPLARIVAMVSELSESEVAALLSRAGARPSTAPAERSAAPRTPLPGSRGYSSIRSEVEWV